MAYHLGKGSLSKLVGVHADLVRVVKMAIEITPVAFTVLEGLRDSARQATLVAEGFSKTTNSRHLTGDAVDVAPWENGGVPWPDLKKHGRAEYDRRIALFNAVAEAMFQAADELGVLIQWGNDWDMDGIPTAQDPDERGQIPDMPHFQRPWPYNEAKARAAAERRRAA